MQPEYALWALVDFYYHRLRTDADFIARVDDIFADRSVEVREQIKTWLQTGPQWTIDFGWKREPQPGPIVSLLVQRGSDRQSGQLLSYLLGRDPALDRHGAVVGYTDTYMRLMRDTYTLALLAPNFEEVAWMDELIEQAILDDLTCGIEGRETRLYDAGLTGEVDLAASDPRPDERWVPDWAAARVLYVTASYERKWARTFTESPITSVDAEMSVLDATVGT